MSFSSHHRKPEPKGASKQLITIIIEMKRRNPSFGRVRVARKISHAFDTEIDKRRASSPHEVLAVEAKGQ
jgi:hypothetical protein